MAAEKVTAPAETEAELGKERAKMVGLEIREEMEKMMVGLEIEEEIEAKEAKRSHMGVSNKGERTLKSREL